MNGRCVTLIPLHAGQVIDSCISIVVNDESHETCCMRADRAESIMWCTCIERERATHHPNTPRRMKPVHILITLLHLRSMQGVNLLRHTRLRAACTCTCFLSLPCSLDIRELAPFEEGKCAPVPKTALVPILCDIAVPLDVPIDARAKAGRHKGIFMGDACCRDLELSLVVVILGLVEREDFEAQILIEQR